MSIPEYCYASGETHGDAAERPAPPSPLPPYVRVSAKTALRLRARRARTDPAWAGRSERSKRALIAADLLDERGDLR